MAFIAVKIMSGSRAALQGFKSNTVGNPYVGYVDVMWECVSERAVYEWNILKTAHVKTLIENN